MERGIEMTAEDHREAARAARKRSIDSFERCDTDGFLSQWASDMTSREHDANAKILEDGGVSTFTGLYEGNRRVRAAMVTVYNRYSHRNAYKWVVHDDDPICSLRKWIPCGGASRVQKGLGLCERKEIAPARAILAGDDGGNVYVKVIRTGDREGRDAILVPDEEPFTAGDE